VHGWERRDREQYSEPQIAMGARIGAKLEQWRATLGRPRQEVPSAPATPAAAAAGQQSGAAGVD